MKVLYINTVFEKGSTGRIIQDIGEVMENRGHEYVALYGRPPLSDDPHAVFIGGLLNAKIHAGLSRITDRSGFYSVSATRKAIRFIREYKPDVIHLHNLHGYYINLGILFSFLKNEYSGKVIWTLHDCWAFTGHCVHYTYAKCEKWKTQCSHCPEKKRYPASLVRDNSKNNFAKKKELFTGLKNMTIVTPSMWLAGQVKNSFLAGYPCVVINNGIDLKVFKPQEIQENKPFILNVVDGLDDRKGFSDLVEISKNVSDVSDVVIIGVSKKDLDRIPNTVTAICRTSNQWELAKYYSTANYLVNVTYEDTFPTVNIESLACGTPIITYRSGGSPEIVDEKSGYVVDVGDVESIISIIKGKKKLKSDSCRSRADYFDKWKKYEEYVELYLG